MDIPNPNINNAEGEITLHTAEYIWIDGTEPTPQLRSKTKILTSEQLSDPPAWTFDGSSTNQATGNNSDCILQPVRVTYDPIRPNGALILCEVFNSDLTPSSTNNRAKLRKVLAEGAAELAPVLGFEQEYTMFNSDNRPFGFPEEGEPSPQGPYYCSVGQDNHGRSIAEHHMKLCLVAKLTYSGANAEVMPGQWEYQIGPATPLRAGDDVWISRWILQRISENYGITISYSPKPVAGDWNGAGMHMNFSTSYSREENGIVYLQNLCEHLSNYTNECLAGYGADYQSRLTGEHETASYKDYRWGIADRTASIRIPFHVSIDKAGYIEDRRPNANADPYLASAVLLKATTQMQVEEAEQQTAQPAAQTQATT